MTQIEFKNVCKSFGKLTVLKNFSLKINAGESLVIIGGSGTGKSVSLKCLLGLIAPDFGDILIDGVSTVGISENKRQKINDNIGMLFQNSALFDSMNVFDNIAFALHKNSKTSAETIEKIVLDCLEKVALNTEVLNKFPADLSGGMKKRVALARAIATSPNIILFDEPTTGLDPISAASIDELIKYCVRTLGALAITVTHDIQSVRRIADRVAFLYDGEIMWNGTVKQMDTTDNIYIRQFITGSSIGPIKWAKKLLHSGR